MDVLDAKTEVYASMSVVGGGAIYVSVGFIVSTTVL